MSWTCSIHPRVAEYPVTSPIVSPLHVPRRVIMPQLRRDTSTTDDFPPKWFTSVEVGDYVARGPRWPLGDMSDGGPGGLGIVEQVDSSEMKVRPTQSYHLRPMKC